MQRVNPDKSLDGVPCSIVAVSCALGYIPNDLPSLRYDGYATLETANKFIRKYLSVKKRIYYKRGERPKLKELNIEGKALVCVYGHMVYLDHDTYYSFFDNEEDDVVSIWLLK